MKFEICRGWGCLSIVLLLTVLFAQARDELLWRYDADFPLLVGDAVEEVGQAGEQVLLAPRLPAIGQDLLPEGPAEVERLQHRVAVAGVPKLGVGGEKGAFFLVPDLLGIHPQVVKVTYVDQAEVVLIDRKLLRSNLFLQSRGIGAL